MAGAVSPILWTLNVVCDQCGEEAELQADRAVAIGQAYQVHIGGTWDVSETEDGRQVVTCPLCLEKAERLERLSVIQGGAADA